MTRLVPRQRLTSTAGTLGACSTISSADSAPPGPSASAAPASTTCEMSTWRSPSGRCLDYLALNRPTDTLSRGRGQRVKVVGHLGSTLIDLLYVFDEPSIGLHARNVTRLITVLRKLRDHGNTVLVVETRALMTPIRDVVYMTWSRPSILICQRTAVHTSPYRPL